MFDSLNMHSLESSLIDIMRAEQDPMKGKAAVPFLSVVAAMGEVVWEVGGGGFRRRRSCSVRRPGVARGDSVLGGDGPLVPRAELFFHSPAYFVPH